MSLFGTGVETVQAQEPASPPVLEVADAANNAALAEAAEVNAASDAPIPAAPGDLLAANTAAPAASESTVTPVPEVSEATGPDLSVGGLQANEAADPSAAGLEAAALEGAPMSLTEAETVAKQAIENMPKRITFRAKGMAVYDDNISLSSVGADSDLILSAGGGFTWTPMMSSRRKLTFDYDGLANFYMDNSRNNGVDHVALLNGYLDSVDTKVSLMGNYSHLTGVEQESRQFDTRDVFGLSASLSQNLTGKLFLDASVNYNNSAYDSLESTSGFSGSIGLSWALTAKARVGFAVSGGYTDSDSLGNQDYESAVLTAGYNASEKLNLHASAGMQRGGTVGDLVDDDEANFVFNLGGTYQLKEKTTIIFDGGMGNVSSAVQTGGAAASEEFNFSLSASHQFNDRLSGRVSASRSTPASTVIANASYESTRFGIGVTRSIGPRLSLSLDGGIETADYISTVTGGSIGRNEDTWFLRTNLTWNPRVNTAISLFYDFREVSSNNAAFEYDQNRIGLSVGRSW